MVANIAQQCQDEESSPYELYVTYAEFKQKYAQLSLEGKDYLKAKHGDFDRLPKKDFYQIDNRDLWVDLNHEIHLDYWNYYSRRFDRNE